MPTFVAYLDSRLKQRIHAGKVKLPKPLALVDVLDQAGIKLTGGRANSITDFTADPFATYLFFSAPTADDAWRIETLIDPRNQPVTLLTEAGEPCPVTIETMIEGIHDFIDSQIETLCTLKGRRAYIEITSLASAEPIPVAGSVTKINPDDLTCTFEFDFMHQHHVFENKPLRELSFACGSTGF